MIVDDYPIMFVEKLGKSARYQDILMGYVSLPSRFAY
jgi:hypothetical protein